MVGRKRFVRNKIGFMIDIDITDRMFAAFGYVPSGYPKQEVMRAGIAAAYASDAAISIGLGRANIALIKNRIGANVFVNGCSFADLTLRNSENGKCYEFANGLLSEAATGILAPPPMLSFQRDKNIIKTAVDGSDSEVVESFGCKSWEITMEGILVDMENHQYPQTKMQEFREMFEINNTFEVLDCDILADLGIENVYIDKLNELKVLMEYQDTIKYKLIAHSIKPVEFFI